MIRRDPKRLRVAGADPRARRALEATAKEQPSEDLRARMAAALGVPVPTMPQSPTEVPGPEGVAAPPVTPFPWLAVGLVGALVAGAVVTVSTWRSPPKPRAVEGDPVSAVARPAHLPPEPMAPSEPANPAPTAVPSSQVNRPAAIRSNSGNAEGNLREQTQLVDRARAALVSGEAAQTLALSLRYQARFPAGLFQPEIASLRIEALAALGKLDEARALARKFLKDFPSGPLTERVSALAGP